MRGDPSKCGSEGKHPCEDSEEDEESAKAAAIDAAWYPDGFKSGLGRITAGLDALAQKKTLAEKDSCVELEP